jgi:hypothetical protein
MPKVANNSKEINIKELDKDINALKITLLIYYTLLNLLLIKEYKALYITNL